MSRHPAPLATRLVRAASVTPSSLAMLGACILVGAVGTLADAIDTASGPLRWLVLAKDAIDVYGVLAVSLLAAVLGASVARLAEVTVPFGASWTAQHRAAWFAGMVSGVAGGALVLVGVLVSGVVRSHSPHWSSDLDRGLAANVLRTLAAMALVGALGVAAGLIARKTPTAIAVLLLLQLPGFPFMAGIYSRSETAQSALGLLPFGAVRGLTSGNSGTYLGAHTSTYTVQPPALLFAVLALWLAGAWAWSAALPLNRGSAATTRRRALVPAAGLIVATLIGGLTAAFGVSSVPWRWSPDWREATAAGNNSRQVTTAWLEAVRSKDTSAASALVSPAHEADVPEEVQEAVRQASSYVVSSEKDMPDADHVSVLLTFSPSLRSGQLFIDAAQVAVDLTPVRGQGWKLTATDYPALHVTDAP
ncbi:hypothetical protein [Cellulomonas sp.]|uniref:hypothetical protein n=1 Tax=Cellulomonas sp. TaxID=40001 RepID=UPI002589119B|nr:hypothetical protein [Cellulomonas sp.]MCR6688098.1 hypothetical protein [Cellulomonas sp.]